MTFDELKKEFIDSIELDDFSGDLQLVAQECGKEIAIILSEKLPKVELNICSAKRLDEDNLSSGLDLVLERCGRDVLYLLVDKMGGMTIYIRPATKIESVRERFVKKHFNGSNRDRIALILGCTTRHVYNINEAARKPSSIQSTLF